MCDFQKYACATAAAAILAGCGGTGASTPPALAQGAIANAVSHHTTGYGTMPSTFNNARHRKVKSDAYIYVDDYGSNVVYVYGYDTKTGMFGSEVGSTNSGISGPQGGCANSTGEVYVANTNDTNLLGYKAPSLTSNLTLTDTGEYPVGCAVDSTGDVAVANICNSISCGAGDVAIFKGGTGSPATATCPNLHRYYFISYDAKGNIWVDGESSSYAFAACEIPAGTTSGHAVTFDSAPQFPGAVAWWRKLFLVDDQDAGAIDLFRVKHYSAKLIKSLNPAPPLSEIYGKYLISANAGTGGIATYTFPGLKLVDTLSCCSEPLGIAVVK